MAFIVVFKKKKKAPIQDMLALACKARSTGPLAVLSKVAFSKLAAKMALLVELKSVKYRSFVVAFKVDASCCVCSSAQSILGSSVPRCISSGIFNGLSISIKSCPSSVHSVVYSCI